MKKTQDALFDHLTMAQVKRRLAAIDEMQQRLEVERGCDGRLRREAGANNKKNPREGRPLHQAPVTGLEKEL
jgi:hypothetical protein